MMAAATYRAHLIGRLIEADVPLHLWDGLIEYLAARRPVGHFLTAVLSNDLTEACHRADVETCTHLVNIVRFLVYYAPANAWGSPEKVVAWLENPREPVPEIFE